ncbi:uncharacterized protein LOC128011416 [Carassius gibelio]|uniref:uncharacterized protein LOC128011416 n=1 Tax=Carassius gibelio TaxID=101364 RepID=UPI002277CF91|nr:uncharacterized protein LOC128011416 [Carassius gibelio]
MQQSDEASWAPSTRPRRQLKQPSYLKDYEVSAVRPKIRGPSRVSPAVNPSREENRSSQPHVKWSQPPLAPDSYSPIFEESYEDRSLGWPHTTMSYTEGAEASGQHREGLQYSSASLYDSTRELLEPSASAREQGAAQCVQSFERWPMPPLPVPDDSLVPEEEEGDGELPPPPWPSSDYPPGPAAVEEQRVVIVIDRMMSELQLMRDSVTSSITARTRPHSTDRSLNPPQPIRGPAQYDVLSSTPRAGPCSPISRPQPSMYPTNGRSSTQHPVRPDMSHPHATRGSQLSSESVNQGRGPYIGPAPKIPLFIHNDPMEFSRLKLALSNLLPTDASELFKYQILVDHVKLEEACLIADSFINSPRPYTDTMAALTEKFGQPHHVALKRIAAVMDSPEIRRGDIVAFEKFSLHVQSLVGMLQTLGPDGEVELRCGSHVARLLTKLPIEMRANFRRMMFHRPGHTHTLLDLAEWLRYESWCQGYDNPSDIRTPGLSGYRAEKRRSKPVATVLHGAESHKSNQATGQEGQSSSAVKWKGKVKPYCPYCEGTEHFLNKCSALQKLTREEVIEWIKVNKRCWRCGRAHQAAQCDLKKLCNVCQGKHLRVLHDVNTRPNAEQPKAESCLVSTSTEVLYLDRPSSHTRVLLKVVRVLLRNRDRILDTYAILDDGSERTMLLPEAVEKLGLHKKPEDLALRTIRQEVQTLKGAAVSFRISSTTNPKRTFRIVEAFTSQRLGLADHTYPVTNLKKRYKHLADLPIEPFQHVKPLVLIGADYPHLLTPVEPVRLGPPGGPAAIHTRLGWTLQGPAHLIQWAPNIQQCLLTGVSSPATELMQNVEKLWKMDILPYQSSKLAVRSKQDKEALEHLEARTERVQVAGILRYATPLLRKQGILPLRSPKEAVLPSLRSLERRLARDPLQAEEYCAAIRKLVEAGAVRRIDPGEASTTNESWYIPHHLVNHNGKSRLVFNCSFQFQGRSLNDTLLPGPTLGASLLGVLLRFREHAVAVSGDIRGMFHQVRLLPEDQPLLRFIWRDMKRDNPPEVFQWQVLPFGTACSPCCATFALQRHARDHGGSGEEIQHSVERCFYVDNCLQSVHTANEAKELVDRLREVLASGGFELRQWACNIPDVLRHLPAEARSDSTEQWLSHDEPDQLEPALGLSWNWRLDVLGYKSRPLDYEALTMRNVYKVLARQYDPLGFIAPYTTRAKLIVQSMWDKPRDWDDPCIPQDLQKAWKEWESELHLLPSILVPRPYAPGLTEEMVVSRQIHVFSDASERVYGSVSYLRTEDVQGRVYLAFLAARSRVAPRRQLSIPRLELCGALTAAQLSKTIQRELTVKTDKTVIWSDSTTVLSWLQSESCRFKVFVGTRVAEIQELTAESTWRYVDSSQNPADDVTRGKTLAELAVPNRWSQGPSFLQKGPAEWPSSPKEITEQDITEYKKVASCGVISRADRKESYLSWKDMVEGTAQEVHGTVNQGEPLTAEDYCQAEKKIFQKIQSECFPVELRHLKAGKDVLRSSRLLTLSPELDPDEGIIRVGGRLRRTEGLDPAFKHPIVLDPSHPATKLLIQDCDARLCHPGPERVFAEMRRTFWILRGREAIRRVQTQCQECRRWKSKPSVPKMADLPVARLRLYKPAFYSTGVDCFGPLQVKIGRRSEKRWGIIYKCLTTRAVHLDLLHAMDSDSFLMSLRRFIARRGSPAELYSDQGTNFKGGEKELSDWFNRMSSDLKQLLAKQKIYFRFNPPAAPHFGGTWEREIKSVKTALYTVIGVQPVSEEVLLTVLLEVEAILNSKPLGYTSSSVADLDAVTPNVFLMGRLDGALPPVVYPKSEGLSRRRWRHCQVLADHFWARFIRCYLPTLQCRQKWHGTTADLTVGSVVLLMDPQFPRALWPVGRVVKVHPSGDGHVRSVDVQVKDKVYTRPVARLITLPVIPDAGEDEECRSTTPD